MIASAPHAEVRRQPASEGAEKGLLGSCLLDDRAIPECEALVQPPDFWWPAYGTIWRAILAVHRTMPADFVTVSEELERMDELERVGGSVAVADLVAGVPHSANATYYAHIVRSHALRRRIMDAATAINERGYALLETAEDYAAEAERSLLAAVGGGLGGDSFPLSDVLAEAMGNILRRRDGELTGIPTGLKDLDGFLGLGMAPGHLIVLGARPGNGKTALAVNLCVHASVDLKIPSLIVSLEMAKAELGERIIAGRAEIDGTKLKRAWEITEAEMEKMHRVVSALSECPMHVDHRAGQTLASVLANSRRHKANQKIGLLAVDYLQLVRGTGGDDRGRNRQEVVAEISGRLKDLARNLEIPVLAMCQLNRDCEGRTDRRPLLSDLRESGAIEQDADAVILIHRPEKYDEHDQPGVAELIVAKNRHGATGTARVAFRKKFTRFADLDERHGDAPAENEDPF
jgi:replicative DNA helicase